MDRFSETSAADYAEALEARRDSGPEYEAEEDEETDIMSDDLEPECCCGSREDGFADCELHHPQSPFNRKHRTSGFLDEHLGSLMAGDYHAICMALGLAAVEHAIERQEN